MNERWCKAKEDRPKSPSLDLSKMNDLIGSDQDCKGTGDTEQIKFQENTQSLNHYHTSMSFHHTPGSLIQDTAILNTNEYLHQNLVAVENHTQNFNVLHAGETTRSHRAGEDAHEATPNFSDGIRLDVRLKDLVSKWKYSAHNCKPSISYRLYDAIQRVIGQTSICSQGVGCICGWSPDR